MGRNNFCTIGSMADLQKIIKERNIDEGSGENYDIYVSLDKYNHETMDKLFALIAKIKHFNYSPFVHIDTKDLRLDEKDYALIVDFSVDMKNIGVDVNFYDISQEYSVEESVDAFFNAEKFIDAVKSLDLSPLETHYLIHGYIASIKYKENEQEKRKSRSLINVLTGDNVVCYGYAKLETYLHEKLGIESVVQILDSYKRDGEHLGTHSNVLVYLDDKKYGVKGYGYSDVTWDVADEKEEPYLSYLFAFLPLKDKDCLKNEKLVVYERGLNALYDDEDKNLLIEDMLLDVSTCRSAFSDLGLSSKFEEIEQEVNNNNFFVKKQKACELLKRWLKDEGIKRNVYQDAVGMPQESTLSFLIAEFMQDKIDEDILQISRQGFESYKQRKETFDNMAVEYGVNSFKIDSYISALKSVSNAETDLLDEDIENAYICIKSIGILKSVLNRGNAKALSLPKVKKVLESIYQKQGASDKFIKKQLERIVDKCVLEADMVFNEKAKNCFKREALRREREQEKREIE